MKKNLYQRACNAIPGGVNSPVRAFKSVGGEPVFMHKGQGAYLYDTEGKKYLDFCMSWGAMILGHAHGPVVKAVQAAVSEGSSFGCATEKEILLAEKVKAALPSLELIRFVSSGTEAVMSALRVARGFTGRDTIIKFEGCYHGHADHLLVSAGSGVMELSQASSAGIPRDFVKHTVVLPYNDPDIFCQTMNKIGSQVAAVIVEPVAANMGVVLPRPGFLETLRQETHRHGALLIFDEVITGFRLGLSGAQGHFGITPDLTCLGKIIGGGFPVGAFGGRKDVMSVLSPLGPVYQAGTLSGNPVAMTAGLATLQECAAPQFYQTLEAKAQNFYKKLQPQLPPSALVQKIGSMFTIFFTSQKSIEHYGHVQQCSAKDFAAFFHRMLEQGVYFSPAPYEANFISAVHEGECFR